MELSPEAKTWVNGKTYLEGPITGDGDNPLKALRTEFPNTEPTTIADYMAWVKFRYENVERMIEANETRLALEGIARMEGDLMQVRSLLKMHKSTAVIDVTLGHLGEEK